MPPDEPNYEEDLEELPEDGETPFRSATNQADNAYPSLDTDQDETEIYQQGIDLKEPNSGNTVEGYDPSKDGRLGRNGK